MGKRDSQPSLEAGLGVRGKRRSIEQRDDANGNDCKYCHSTGCDDGSGSIFKRPSLADIKLGNLKDEAKIKRVKRYSDDYFALVTANSPDENAVLARQKTDEELIVKLRGQVYLFE